MENEKKLGISRRDFLKSTVAGVTTLAMASVFSITAAANDGPMPEGGAPMMGGGAPMMGGSAAIEDPDWRIAPDPNKYDVEKVLECEVLVLGTGYAGSICARRAAAGGKKVIAVDQQTVENFNLYGGDVGVVNSSYQKKMGVPEVSPTEYINNWQMCCANRTEPDLLKYYAYHCGEAFDYFTNCLADGAEDKFELMAWEGLPKEWNSKLGDFHTYPGAVSIKQYGSAQVALDNINDAVDNYGMQMLWGHSVRVLLQDEDGRVTGAIVMDEEEDEYVQINASVAVVVALGDFSANTTMFRDLVPEIMESNPNSESPSGNGRSGMGQKLCYWAGGAFEIGPRAGMGGVSGNPMGVWQGTHILLIDKDGYRFCNEAFAHNFVSGIPAQRREAGLCSVFGSNFRETVSRMPIGHLNLSDFVSLDEQEKIFSKDHEDSGPEGFTYGRSTVYCAHDLETLASYCGYEGEAAKQFVESVNRYNEMCEKGVDEDYAKPAEVLQKIEAPYFAVYSAGGGGAGVLVTLAGMFTDRNCQVRAQKTFKPIPGLFAIGNCCGGRFPLQYTSPINGVSIAWAMTTGYQVGDYLGNL